MALAPAGRLLPGVGLALAVAVAARAFGGVLPFSEVPIALLAGLLLANLAPLGPGLTPGLAFAVLRLLRAGIVLLGAQLSLAAVLAAGLAALALVVVLVAATLAAMVAAARLIALDARLGLLVAVGTAICGNTAILATAPIIGARDRDVSIAVATITLFGTAAVFVYPLVGAALGLEPHVFGTWAGTAVNDTSQVLAAGFAYGEEAGQTATVVKLTRNTLLAPVLLVIALWWSRASAVAADGAAQIAPRLPQAMPLFVLGFLGMALLNTLGAFDVVFGSVELADHLAATGRFLVLVALAAVGLSTHVGPMRDVGPSALYVGLAGGVCLALTSLAAVTLIGS